MAIKVGIFITKLYNFTRSSMDINSSKKLWASLAQSGIGIANRAMTPDEMKTWGNDEYHDLVKNDRDVPKGGIALDLGCGVGRMTEFFLKDFKKVYGTDISAEFIRQAEGRVPGIVFMETDGQTIPLIDSCLDFIFSNAVFQCMPSKEIIINNLREVYRTLKIGGRAKIQFRGTPVKKNKWFYGYSFSEMELKQLLTHMGFKIVRFDVDRRKVGGKVHFIAVTEK